jgi:molecular chaperone GrpE
MKKRRDRVEIPIGDEEAPEGRPAPPDDLEEQLVRAQEEARAAKDELLRRIADLDNTRKRLARDHDRACAAAARGIVGQLLPVLDDLTRAIDVADADEAVPQHHVDSIRMLDRKIYDVLRNEGLEVIRAQRGDPFDPEIHEAVAAACDPEMPENVILSAWDPGYMFKGVLLKPARVEVCVAPREGGEGPEA